MRGIPLARTRSGTRSDGSSAASIRTRQAAFLTEEIWAPDRALTARRQVLMAAPRSPAPLEVHMRNCRSSFVQLDGLDAPRTTTITYPEIPGGTYDVQMTVLGPGGKPRATTSQEIKILSAFGG
jgi:hypothetical protein